MLALLVPGVGMGGGVDDTPVATTTSVVYMRQGRGMIQVRRHFRSFAYSFSTIFAGMVLWL